MVDRLYEAFLGGDAEGMLALFSDDVDVRFLGQARLRGVGEARRFFEFAGPLLTDLDFRIERVIVDGEWAAATWSETARTATGDLWENHGVDVFHVAGEQIVVLHENNDVRMVHEHFPRYRHQTDSSR